MLVSGKSTQLIGHFAMLVRESHVTFPPILNVLRNYLPGVATPGKCGPAVVHVAVVQSLDMFSNFDIFLNIS